MTVTTPLESKSIKINSKNNNAGVDSRRSVLTSMAALNFRVPAEFKKNFKIAAATYGIKQSELLQQLFSDWLKQQHGKE
jgi:hypothetical protein